MKKSKLEIDYKTRRMFDSTDKLFLYGRSELKSMCMSNTWYNSILEPKDFGTNPDTKFKLHATGDVCLSHGRKYVALPANINPKDPNIKQKYNLM